MKDQESRKKQKLSETESSSLESSHSPYYIPREIVSKILHHLPIKSLLRFKCVSKQWRRWISETKLQRTRLLLTTERTIDQRGVVQDAYVPFDKMSTRQLKKWECKILGSCNGLLLVTINEKLYLCNLSTRRFNRTFSSFEYLTNSSYKVEGGLCFDSSNNDYMAVLAVSHESPGYHDFITVGSSKNNTWTRINFPYKVRRIEQGTVLNNHLHWCVTDENEDYFGRDWVFPSQHIVYFDPKRYAFKELPIPKPNDQEGDSIASLGVLDGCLCMARCTDCIAQQCNIEVFVMKKYGVKESWALLFKFRGVDFYRGFQVYFYMEKKDEVLMRVSISGREKLVTYDTRRNIYTETVNSVPISTFLYNIVLPMVYEETLVDPPTDDRSSKKKRYER